MNWYAPTRPRTWNHLPCQLQNQRHHVPWGASSGSAGTIISHILYSSRRTNYRLLSLDFNSTAKLFLSGAGYNFQSPSSSKSARSTCLFHVRDKNWSSYLTNRGWKSPKWSIPRNHIENFVPLCVANTPMWKLHRERQCQAFLRFGLVDAKTSNVADTGALGNNDWMESWNVYILYKAISIWLRCDSLCIMPDWSYDSSDEAKFDKLQY